MTSITSKISITPEFIIEEISKTQKILNTPEYRQDKDSPLMVLYLRSLIVMKWCVCDDLRKEDPKFIHRVLDNTGFLPSPTI